MNNFDSTILIGLAGSAGSGKDTVASMLGINHGFWQFSFASPIKAAIERMFALTPEQMHGEQKEEIINWLGRSPRYLMQTLGTEWGRNLVNDGIWLMLLEKALHDGRSDWNGFNREKPFSVVISDVRFENEAEWIRAQGGIIAHVIRDTGRDDGHASEAGIPLVDGDWRLDNGGSLKDLHCLVDEMVASLSALCYYDLAAGSEHE